MNLSDVIKTELQKLDDTSGSEKKTQWIYMLQKYNSDKNMKEGHQIDPFFGSLTQLINSIKSSSYGGKKNTKKKRQIKRKIKKQTKSKVKKTLKN